ncbi:MAG: PHP domain-containing protein [Thermotogae bacterium]|nr:PHP domain-containing protein [Thermotogota bacterium]
MFRFDFHIHSIYSADGILSPQRIIKIAYLKGLNAVAITDHDTIKGGLQAKSIKQDEIIIVVGSEVNTDFGDIIGLFLNEEIKSRRFEEVIDEIRAQGGIVVLPHPYRRKKFPDEELLKRVDVIEGVNGRVPEELNLKAQELARKLKKPMIAGSDAHFPFELGRIWNVAENVSNCDEEELKKVLLNGGIEMCSKNTHLLLRKTSIILGTGIKRIRSLRVRR